MEGKRMIHMINRIGLFVLLCGITVHSYALVLPDRHIRYAFQKQFADNRRETAQRIAKEQQLRALMQPTCRNLFIHTLDFKDAQNDLEIIKILNRINNLLANNAIADCVKNKDDALTFIDNYLKNNPDVPGNIGIKNTNEAMRYIQAAINEATKEQAQNV
jgi:hypothetical protein